MIYSPILVIKVLVLQLPADPGPHSARPAKRDGRLPGSCVKSRIGPKDHVKGAQQQTYYTGVTNKDFGCLPRDNNGHSRRNSPESGPPPGR